MAIQTHSVVSVLNHHGNIPESLKTVRNNIVTFFGDVPRIELFAREQSPGWSVLGNQSDKYNEQELLATRKEEAARPKKRLKK